MTPKPQAILFIYFWLGGGEMGLDRETRFLCPMCDSQADLYPSWVEFCGIYLVLEKCL